MILDAWAQASNISFSSARYGDIAIVREKGREFYLLKPSTYMNLSGNAVRYWMQKLGLGPEQIMVICDDLNLPFGTLRMRKGGSDGGHNGLKNIAELTGTTQYPRTRVGVGHEFGEGEQINFVLGNFSPEQAAEIPGLAARVMDGIRTWAFTGIDRAMSQLNVRPRKEQLSEISGDSGNSL